MKIADGSSEDHPTPLPYDPASHPAVQSPTPRYPEGNEQGAVRDLTGERIQWLAASEASIAAAMSSGMSAEGGRRQHYYSDMVQDGPATYGDPVGIAGYVYDATVPPASQDPYTNSGDEPVG